MNTNQFRAVRTCSGKDPQFNGALVLNGKTVVTRFIADTPEEAESAWASAQASAKQYNEQNSNLSELMRVRSLVDEAYDSLSKPIA